MATVIWPTVLSISSGPVSGASGTLPSRMRSWPLKASQSVSRQFRTRLTATRGGPRDIRVTTGMWSDPASMFSSTRQEATRDTKLGLTAVTSIQETWPLSPLKVGGESLLFRTIKFSSNKMFSTMSPTALSGMLSGPHKGEWPLQSVQRTIPCALSRAIPREWESSRWPSPVECRI